MAARCWLRPLGRELSRPRKKPILTEHASETICSYMNSFTTWGTELIALSCMHGARSTTIYHSTMAQDRSLDRRLSSLSRRPRGGGLSRSKLCSDTGPSNRHGRPPLFTSRVVEHGDLPFVKFGKPLRFQTTDDQFQLHGTGVKRETGVLQHIIVLIRPRWYVEDLFCLVRRPRGNKPCRRLLMRPPNYIWPAEFSRIP